MTPAIPAINVQPAEDTVQYIVAEPCHYEAISQLIQEIEQKIGQYVSKSDLKWYQSRADGFRHVVDEGTLEKHFAVLQREGEYFEASQNSEFEECKAHLQGVLSALEVQVKWGDSKELNEQLNRTQSIDPLSSATRSDYCKYLLVPAALVIGSVAGLVFLSFQANR